MKNDSYILIVEDSHTQAKQIEMILKQFGYPVSVASNGKEALEFLKNHKTIIVVADILMPEMNGYELCRIIKSDSRYKGVPVVLLTQLSDPKEIIRGLECGADDFVVKPYNEEFLLARIQAVIALKLRHDASCKEVNILVVEDSPTQAEQLRYLLEEYGFTVTAAVNGREGLETARRIRPALIISDILMPEMDGYELAHELKRDEELKKTPIILVTSLMDKKEISRRATVIADGYFTKPYDGNYLVSKIESLLSVSGCDNNMGDTEGMDVNFAGEHYKINSGRRQILTFLLSTYENAVQQNLDLVQMQRELQAFNEQLEEKVMKRTEMLRSSEENFSALARNANDGILIVAGSNGDFVFANNKISEITGYGLNEILKKSIKDAVHPDDLPIVAERYKKRIEGMPLPEQYEIRIISKDGTVIPAEITAARTVWQGLPASITIVRDIAERKKREGELIRASKLESLGILAGGIAHDFNNLLTGIIGNASLARMLSNPDDKIYKVLTNLESASLRAKDLTQQLLTFSKGGEPVKKTVSISEVIRDSAGFALSGSNVRCDFLIAKDLWPLEADEGQIGQVIHNLILNAKQAMPGGGTITVSAENVLIGPESSFPIKEGRYVKITVKDTGIGISGEHLSKIFDPYFTTKQEGSGLGLATAYSVIKKHDGYISVESGTGEGTAFYIHLPVSSKEIIFRKHAEDKPLRGKGRILIMDDEEIVRGVAGAILTELGYEVGFAIDGAEAVELYRKHKESGQPFNAVIMDLTIPGGMGGSEAIGKLLEIDLDAKAIVSSGYSDDPVMSDFRKYGFSAVISKPYRVADLGRTIHQVLTETDKH